MCLLEPSRKDARQNSRGCFWPRLASLQCIGELITKVVLRGCYVRQTASVGAMICSPKITHTGLMKVTLWPETPRPDHEISCDHCELAHQSAIVHWGEGNPRAPVWILLDNPGSRLDKNGQPSVCGTRQTLYQAATASGFHPSDLYLTFVVRRRPVRHYDKEVERALCINNFWRQIQHRQPSWLLCLGDVALCSFMNQPTLSVKAARQHWWVRDGVTVSASYHPLAVRRRPPLLLLFQQDWQNFYERSAEILGSHPK